MSNLITRYHKLCKLITDGKLPCPLPKEKFQEIHKEFIDLSVEINKSDIFSNNETLQELSYSSIELLIISFNHAEFVDTNAMVMFNPSLGSEKRNKFRLIILRIVEDLLTDFLNKISNYGIIIDLNGDVLPHFKNIKKWIDAFLELKSKVRNEDGPSGFIKLDDLEKMAHGNSGAVGKREFKMEKWQLEKNIKEIVQGLESINEENVNADADADGADDNDQSDELKYFWIKKIELTILKTVNMLDSIVMEREMLERILKSDVDLSISGLNMDGLKLVEHDAEDKDARAKSKAFDKGYTDKLEILNKDKPLLSKEGKVLRPFTIVSSNDKRKEFQSKVFGTGQVLPSMTVEELVDQELANGGMVKPQEPEQEPDEDDNEWQDKETYRLRDWDEFTDSHKKGSGNKMGNLG
ncbi:Tap42 protein [Martiniozyma asiatica (nom. inval.)]|nr:Tap42 protein [Martiniozyma asiatica]